MKKNRPSPALRRAVVRMIKELERTLKFYKAWLDELDKKRTHSKIL